MSASKGRKKTRASWRERVLRSHLRAESFSELQNEDQTLENSTTDGAASLLAQSIPASSRANLNVPQPTPLARHSIRENAEELNGYIQQVVTAAVGASRAEDLRFFTGELERTRECLRDELATVLRDTLALAPTPETSRIRLQHAPRTSDHPARTSYHPNDDKPVPAPRKPSPPRFRSPTRIHSPLRHASPPRYQTPPRRPTTTAESSNMEDFLRQLHNLTLSDPVNAANSIPRHSGPGYRTQNFHKWGLKFDNRKMSVDDFLFRLERLRTSYGATWDEVVINFHHFVAGSVESWFWVFLKANPETTWLTLKSALIEQFRSLESDSEISRMLYDRHQGLSEPFEDFFAAIQQLNGRLRVPKPDAEIIDVLKNNIRRQMGMLLISFHTNSLAEMVHVCRKVEKYLSDRDAQKGRTAPTPTPRRAAVAELEAEVEDDDDLFPEVEAFHPKRERDTRNYTCWNCKVKGHSFMECPDTQRSLFCFKCGLENTTSPKCPRCSGNETKSSLKPRGNCSLEKNPDRH